MGSKGHVKVVTGTDPAAGAEISETVPAGKYWRLLAVNFRFVADATVASRTVKYTVDDGTSVFHRGFQSSTQTASQDFFYNISASGQIQAVNNTYGALTPLPNPCLLKPGYRFKTVTGSIQAGDNYAAPLLYVVEYLTEAAMLDDL